MIYSNVYASPGSHMSCFREVFDLIGDLNMLFDPLLDTTNRKRRRNPTDKSINKVLKD